MDEVEDSAYTDEVQYNKKFTLYVVDGGPDMFKDPTSQNCPFRKALKVVYHQMINISCSGSFSQHVGLIITNTESSKNRFNQKFSFELIELDTPSKEDLYELKKMIDSEDISEAFRSRFGGHAEVNLANLIWSCKKLMTMAGTSSRHHIIMYLSNNTNPFKNDAKSYVRLKTILTDFCQHSYVDKKGIRRLNKTPGEFHVLMMSEEVAAEDEERWREISNSFFVGDVDDLDIQAYKRTYTQRAFSRLLLDIGPNIQLGVSVYTLAKEATLQKKTVLDSATEAPLGSKTAYVKKDESSSSTVSQQEERSNLHKVVKIGGKTLMVENCEIREPIDFNAKGVVLLGFKPIEELDMFGDHLSTPQFIIPNDNDVRGSTQLFRALHERCYERKMAMICRFQSRSNQKIRLIALVAEKKENSESISRDYKNDGFYVIYLPYAEDVRNFEGKAPPGYKNLAPTDEDVDVTGKFIRNLKKPFAPETFSNPRILSFCSMVTEAAIGEKIEIKDTLEPYFKSRSEDFTNKLITPLMEHFDLSAESKETETMETAAKRPRLTGPEKDLEPEELIRSGKADKVKVADLKKFMADHMPQQNRNLKKNELVQTITDYLKQL
ncbi:unnamed protein product [Auanema sp. JU1783]|nr:unnamed protein product [Auanema sp. JU1783]